MREELLYEVFDLLYKAWVKDVEEPTRFVGLQGDAIVVIVKGGDHFGIRIVPASVGVPS